MIDFAYNSSDKLQSAIEKIEAQRIKILITPLSPADELKLRWEAQVDRIFAAFSLGGSVITRHEIVRLLSEGKNKKFTSLEREVIDYKRGFDYLSQNWLVSKKNISVRTLAQLYTMVNRRSTFPVKEGEIKNLLDFLQSSREHCITVSGIATLQYLTNTGHGFDQEKLARLLAYLFLYKSGFDCRGLINIEEYYQADRDRYRTIVESSRNSRNLTLWLEYFAQGIAEQLEEVEKDVVMVRLHLNIPAHNWQLNDRQREILTLLEQPDTSMTNRKVQHLFKVSQITASRDLARLEALGIIFAHGKGRSVYYTRV